MSKKHSTGLATVLAALPPDLITSHRQKVWKRDMCRVSPGKRRDEVQEIYLKFTSNDSK